MASADENFEALDFDPVKFSAADPDFTCKPHLVPEFALSRERPWQGCVKRGPDNKLNWLAGRGVTLCCWLLEDTGKMMMSN